MRDGKGTVRVPFPSLFWQQAHKHLIAQQAAWFAQAHHPVPSFQQARRLDQRQTRPKDLFKAFSIAPLKKWSGKGPRSGAAPALLFRSSPGQG